MFPSKKMCQSGSVEAVHLCFFCTNYISSYIRWNIDTSLQVSFIGPARIAIETCTCSWNKSIYIFGLLKSDTNEGPSIYGSLNFYLKHHKLNLVFQKISVFSRCICGHVYSSLSTVYNQRILPYVKFVRSLWG